MDYIYSRCENKLIPIYCSNPSIENKRFSVEIEKNVLQVLRNGNYILADNVNNLENDFAQFIGTSHSIAVASGTDAILLSLRALDIGFGDEVITVAHTAIATIAAIELSGATPVLVDINQSTFTIDVLKIEAAITSKTKALVAVHIYGHPAEIIKIKSICDNNDLKLIEDVSQAHGAKCNNLFLGSIGDVGCFSCYPTKNLGACGDAGLITTKSSELAKKIKMLREYGWINRVSEICGHNSRMDEIQAVILRVKLKYLTKSNLERNKIANFYFKNLQNTPLKLPFVKDDCFHVFHQYVVRTKIRDKLKNFLESKLVFPGIHYSLPVHKHPAYENRLLVSDSLKNTESISSEILSLPIYPGLMEEQYQKVVDLINSFFES